MTRVAHLGVLLATVCTLAFAAPVLAQSSGGSSSGGSSSGGASSGGAASSGAASGGTSSGASSSGSVGGATSGGSMNGSPSNPTLSSPSPGGSVSAAPDPTPGAAATAPLDPNGASTAQTGVNAPTGTATSGGVAGTTGQRQTETRCREILAHQDDFTANAVAACKSQAGESVAPATQREVPTGSVTPGIKPVDRAAEVQKKVEGSDNKSVNGICSNCKSP